MSSVTSPKTAKSYTPKNSVWVHKNVEPGGITEWRFYLRGTPPTLPLPLTILIGEAIHQLRTILEHLVYQAVIGRTHKPPAFNSSFPIVGKGRNKRGKWFTAAQYYADITSRLKADISADAATLIDSLQPYKRGVSYEDDPLWTMSELDNAYKHRLLVVIGQKVKRYAVSITGPSGEIKRQFAPDLPFENGTEIARVSLPGFAGVADSDVSVKSAIVFAIAFKKIGNRSNVSVLGSLNDIRDHVNSIITAFSRLPEFV
jgi:hypothetical protein